MIHDNWLHVDPRMGRDAVDELDRCLRQGNGFVGLGAQTGQSPA